MKPAAPKTRAFRPDELKVIGKAPLCPNCPDTFMVPLNRKDEPELCRCPSCGAQDRFAWVN